MTKREKVTDEVVEMWKNNAYDLLVDGNGLGPLQETRLEIPEKGIVNFNLLCCHLLVPTF